MILKYWDPVLPSGDTLSNSVRAIEYAVRMGARIINYSGGGSIPSREEEDAIKRAAKKGVLVIAAAGNDGRNIDRLIGFFPASYPIENILSVGSCGKQGRLLKSSNFGILSVDIAAPGEDIFSALPGGRYGTMTGTSQATAYVTGVAAKTLQECAFDCSATGLIKKILKQGEIRQGLTGKIASRSVLTSRIHGESSFVFP